MAARARGKRRLHRQPSTTHVRACQPWLAVALQVVQPAVLVALGAVAARSPIGPRFRLTEHRGARLPWPPEQGDFAKSTVAVEVVFATLHPSAVLRGDEDQHVDLYRGLVQDLQLAAAA